ncbi:MAG: MFS transporter [Legionellaceae bacterium]|nr:MFS transporter [Legionellaceae bacterium]
MWKNKTSFKIYFYVLLLVSMYAASYDMYVASLPSLGTFFNVPSNIIQITIIVYVASGMLAAIPTGIFSDRFGRKKCLIVLISMVLIGSIICLYAPNIYWFYVGRSFQGIGGSGVYIVAMSIPKDLLNKQDFSKVWQWLTLAFFIAPSIATSLGGYIVFHFSWQMVFIIIAILCLSTMAIILFTFKETNHPQALKNESKSKVDVLKNYKLVMLNPKFLTYCYVTSLAWAGMGVYYIFLPFIIVNQLHQSTIVFGWTSFSMLIAGVIGRVVNMSFISKRLTLEQTTVIFCVIALLASAILLFTLILPENLSVRIIIGSSVIFGFSSSIAAIAGSTIALNIFDKSLSATATAIYGLTLDCVIAGSLSIAPLLPTGIIMMSLMLIGLSGIALAFLYLGYKSNWNTDR